ncbi:MAG: DUF4215 domain-containing protein [Candidatus Absconditicoccaceae bacterium]
MKNSNFHSNKIGLKHEIKLRNLIMIFFSIIIGLGSIVVFASVEINTNLDYAVQTIKRVIVSTDGTDDLLTRLFDINADDQHKIKLYTDNLSWTEANDLTGVDKILGIDSNGEMIFVLKTLIQGASGSIGPIGATGDIGPVGATGANGTNGLPGPIGATGDIGPAGPAGATGADGADGDIGPRGATGAIGSAGPRGATGADGVGGVGATGAIGPAGADGFLQDGVDGATPFWNGSSWTTNDVNIYNMGSNVRIGSSIPIMPQVKLTIDGMIKISTSNNTGCDADYGGTIRFLNQCFQGCDGTSRVNLGGNCVTNAICGDGIPEGIEQCDDGNINNGDGCSSLCERETQNILCIGLPANSQWNIVDNIIQTRNGTSWAPSQTGAYNITPSTTQCHYICNTNYTWDGSACIADTTTYTCPTKPVTGTVWNTVSSYIQTWNGTSRLPANTSTTYNIVGSTTQCHYECAANYTWDGSACIPSIACGNGTVQVGEQCDDSNTNNGDGCSSLCERETQTYTCSPKPITGTIWNTVSGYIQTWNGSSRSPAATTTTYNATPSIEQSITECLYKCAANYTWDGSACIPSIECGNGTVEGSEQCDNGLLNSNTGECLKDCTYNIPECSVFTSPSVLVGGSGTSNITGDISPRADYIITTTFPDLTQEITHILTGVGTTAYTTWYDYKNTGHYIVTLSSTGGAGVNCSGIVDIYENLDYACGIKHKSDEISLRSDTLGLCAPGYSATNFTGDTSTIKNVIGRTATQKAVIFFTTRDVVPSYAYIDTGKHMVWYSGSEYIIRTGSAIGINVTFLLPEQGYKYRTRDCADFTSTDPVSNCHAHKMLTGDCAYDMDLDTDPIFSTRNLNQLQIDEARANSGKLLKCVLDEPRIDSEDNAQQYKYTRGILKQTKGGFPACQIITGNAIEQSMFYIHRVCPGYNYGDESESCDSVYKTGFQIQTCAQLLSGFYGTFGNTGSIGVARN